MLHCIELYNNNKKNNQIIPSAKREKNITTYNVHTIQRNREKNKRQKKSPHWTELVLEVWFMAWEKLYAAKFCEIHFLFGSNFQFSAHDVKN